MRRCRYVKSENLYAESQHSLGWWTERERRKRKKHMSSRILNHVEIKKKKNEHSTDPWDARNVLKACGWIPAEELW